MKMQNYVLKRYRELYPHHTLKEISDQTGIQISRVFRLFNGSEMKVSEYEAFQNFLEGNPSNTFHFINIARKCLEVLSPESIEKMNIEMQMLLNLKEQSRGLRNLNSQEMRA